MELVAPPNQKCEALLPTPQGSTTNQLCTLGDNCNDLLELTFHFSYFGATCLSIRPPLYAKE